VPEAPPRDTFAVWSAVCAGLGLSICCGLGVILGPTALVLGRISLARIRASGGVIRGAGLARFGLIAGAVLSGIWATILVYYVVVIVLGVTSVGGT
jgi:hypothetical protein